jgi:hypothetical protein
MRPPRLSFRADDIAYLRSLNMFPKSLFDDLPDFRFAGDVFAVAEGTPIFANEPLLEVTAPIGQAQVVETLIVNQISLQTGLRLMPHDPIGRLNLPERVALMSHLPAAFLARAPAKAARDARLLLQPVAGRRLRACRAVQVQSAPQVGVFRPQRRVLAPQRSVLGPQRPPLGPQRLVLAPKPRDFAVQLRNVAHKRVDRVANRGGESHLHLDSWFRRLSAKIQCTRKISPNLLQFFLSISNTLPDAADDSAVIRQA